MKWIFIVPVLALFLIQSASASETVKGAKKDMATFKREMNVKLNSLESEIARLKEQAKVKGGEAKQRAVIELEEARDQVKRDLAELETKSESNWQKLKNKVAITLDRLNTKAQRALVEN